MDNLWQDLRYALRMIGRTPGQTAAAVLALGLGIGLTAAMFSIVYGVILRGLPLEDPNRLIHLEQKNLARDEDSLEVGLHEFLDWRSEQSSFTGLAAYRPTTFNLSGDERPERVDGSFVSANLFSILGIKPALGRDFVAGEDVPNAAPVAILSWQLWKSRYGSDPQILGRVIRVNAESTTVVGVMPPDFNFPGNEVVWSTLRVDPTKVKRGEGDTYEVVGRLRPGVTLAAARAEIEGISTRLAKQYPATLEGVEASVKRLHEEFVPDQISNLLWVMQAGVFSVLLIACLNVANLMLARASTRTRELAIRSALGAGRRRVLAQILAESGLIALFGSALGLGLGALGVRLFNLAVKANEPPYWMRFELDGAAILFTVGLGVFSGLVCGLVPALQAARANLNDVLKDEGRGSSSFRMGWFGRSIVVAEIGFSCLLLVMAGLMVKSVVKVRTSNHGLDTSNVLTFRVALFDVAYPTQSERNRLFGEILARLDGKPGMEAVAATSALPINGTGTDYYAVEGRAYPKANELPEARLQTISSGYFDVFRAKVTSGRDFGSFDRAASEPVAIVNRSFAAKVFPGENPVGRRIRVGRDASFPFRRIVGVVPDLAMNGLNNEVPQGIYLPLLQSQDDHRMSYVVRAKENPLALVAAARAEVTAVDKDLPLYFVYTMDEVIARASFFLDLFGSLFAIFGAAALLLASVGIYAVISFSVSQRTQEIGVRMALGSAPSGVLRLLLGQGLRQIAIGLGLGLPLAFAASRVLEKLLFDVQPSDPSIFTGVPVALAVVALFACLVPARRAMRTDPMTAFRG